MKTTQDERNDWRGLLIAGTLEIRVCEPLGPPALGMVSRLLDDADDLARLRDRLEVILSRPIAAGPKFTVNDEKVISVDMVMICEEDIRALLGEK